MTDQGTDSSELASGQPDGPGGHRSRKAMWWLLGLAVVVIASIAGAGSAERKATQQQFCVSCHLPSSDQVHKSEHEKLECAACHENRGGQNLHQWALGVVSDTKTTEHGKFKKESCKSCHTKGSTEPWQMARTNGHREHVLELKEPLECSTCHAWKEHRTEPKAESCAKCHDDVKIRDEHQLKDRKEKIQCLSCHNYLAEVGGGAQTPSHDCRRCHGGVEEPVRSKRFAEVIEAKGIPRSRIHGNLKTCSLCHKPHEKLPERRQAGLDCDRCHVKIPGEFHAKQRPDEFDCNTCHEVHGPREQLTDACANCHDQSDEPESTIAHKHDRCSQCHQAHVFEASIDGCRDCHADQALVLASWDAQTHADCTNCHKPHSQKEEKTTCSGCHKQVLRRHEACTTCHDPHQDKDNTKSCAKCHGAEVSLLRRAPSAHRMSTCQTCHRPHAMVSAVSRCGGCHKAEGRAVAKAGPAKHRQCSSCHKTHSFAANVSACSSCHKNPTTGVHTGACTKCHQSHGSPIGQAASCRNCHEKIPKPGGRHSACQSCHKSAHGPEVKAPACSTCHKTQASGVAGWKVASHKSCGNCHQTHQPTSPKSCAQCHKKQAATVKADRHSCTNCHDVHQAPKNLGSVCSSCHKRQVSQVSGRGPKHSTCNSCHKPHSVKAPSCNSCHKALPAAHKLRGHDKCYDCHSTHSQKLPTRGDCLKCHKGQRNHFPNASTCAGCHVFTHDQ